MTKQEIINYAVKKKGFIQDVINKDFYYSDLSSVDCSLNKFVTIKNGSSKYFLKYEDINKQKLSVLLKKSWEKKRRRKRKAKKRSKIDLCNEILINNMMGVLS